MNTLQQSAQRLIDLFTLVNEALDGVATQDVSEEELTQAFEDYDVAIDEVAATVDVSIETLENVVYDAYHYGLNAVDVAAFLEEQAN